jgi:hypothetical protein
LAACRANTVAFVIAVGLAHAAWGLPPPQSQRCFDRDYGGEKKDPVAAARTDAAGSADEDDSDSQDGLILKETAPLPEPPEIARVQRGLVSHFIGLFMNDGLESWSAIDLDRNTLVSVQRRVYDVRAKRSHPFADPKFPTERHLGHGFARKFSSPDRTELEVVSTVRIDPPAMQAFICVANASWAAAAAKVPEISDGSQDTRLLDRQSNGGRTTYFSKSVSFAGPLGFVFAAMAKYLPAPSW